MKGVVMKEVVMTLTSAHAEDENVVATASSANND